jgi:hypothetical protein
MMPLPWARSVRTGRMNARELRATGPGEPGVGIRRREAGGCRAGSRRSSSRSRKRGRAAGWRAGAPRAWRGSRRSGVGCRDQRPERALEQRPLAALERSRAFMRSDGLHRSDARYAPEARVIVDHRPAVARSDNDAAEAQSTPDRVVCALPTTDSCAPRRGVDFPGYPDRTPPTPRWFKCWFQEVAQGWAWRQLLPDTWGLCAAGASDARGSQPAPSRRGMSSFRRPPRGASCGRSMTT